MAKPVPRQYPHLDQIQDPAVQASLRLLWDQHYQTLESQAATATTVAAHTASLTTLSTGVALATALARGAQPISTPITSTPPVSPSGNPGNPTPTPPASDNGMGEAGCNAAGANGHRPAQFPAHRVYGRADCVWGGGGIPGPLCGRREPSHPRLLARVLQRARDLAPEPGWVPSESRTTPGTGAGNTYLIFAVNIPAPSHPNVRSTRIGSVTTTRPLQLVSQMIFAGLTVGAATAPDGGIADGVVCP